MKDFRFMFADRMFFVQAVILNFFNIYGWLYADW